MQTKYTQQIQGARVPHMSRNSRDSCGAEGKN